MQKYAFQLFFVSIASIYGVSNAGIIALPNQSPLIAVFAMPSPVDFVEGEKTLSLQLNAANNFVPRNSKDESLFLDGETTRLVVSYRQGLSECWMLGFELPLINHAGGALDSFVDDWHHWFDLPDSGRPAVPNDQLLYRYTVDGEVIINYSERRSGIGDTQLIVTQTEGCALAGGKILRAGIKLPTGDADKLFGSGSADVFLDLSQRFPDVFHSLDFSYTAGLVLLGRSTSISNHNRQVVHASLSLELPVAERLSLDAQLAVQSPIIESDLRVLSDWPVQVLVGMSLQVSKVTTWNIALSEDPQYGTSSDVVFQLGVRTAY